MQSTRWAAFQRHVCDVLECSRATWIACRRLYSTYRAIYHAGPKWNSLKLWTVAKCIRSAIHICTSIKFNQMCLYSELVRIKERLFYRWMKSAAVLLLIVTNIAIGQGQTEITQTGACYDKYLVWSVLHSLHTKKWTSVGLLALNEIHLQTWTQSVPMWYISQIIATIKYTREGSKWKKTERVDIIYRRVITILYCLVVHSDIVWLLCSADWIFNCSARWSKS
jgi:hypothetical protein